MNAESFFQADVTDGDILVVILRGNLDATTTDEFEREIRKHLDEGKSRIIIDCRHLGFVSSMGIGCLMALKTRLRRKGGDVKLAAIQGTAAEVIRLVRLDKILDIHGDLEFARKSFTTTKTS